MSNPPNFVTFPVIAGTSSPAFQFAPIASNSSSGWATACTNSACASTATWSTRATDATLDFTFIGIDFALEGNVQGNPNIEMTFDGNKVDWNPSNGRLFSASLLDQKVEHKLQLKVLSAAADAQLTVGQARINASTETQKGDTFRGNFYTLPSNGPEFSYTGFVQQTTSASGSMSPINYVSTNAGDTVKATLNATTLAIFGPCGPSSGMMTVTLDDRTTTVNTTKPVQADDCMLYLSRGLNDGALHYLTITNADGRPLGLNRVDTVMAWMSNNKSASKAGMVVGIVLGVIVLVAIGIVAYSMRTKKQRDKMNRSCSIFCS